MNSSTLRTGDMPLLAVGGRIAQLGNNDCHCTVIMDGKQWDDYLERQERVPEDMPRACYFLWGKCPISYNERGNPTLDLDIGLMLCEIPEGSTVELRVFEVGEDREVPLS